MKKILSIALLAMMTSMMFVACSSSDDSPAPAPAPTPEPTPTPTLDSPYLGTWNLVNDADPTVITTLVISTEPLIDYSATNTTLNPTIPAGTPTYSKVVKNDPGVIDPWAGGTASFAKEQGYVTSSADGKIIFWPQAAMSSSDGSTWTATPAADMVKMEEYACQLIGNVMALTRGDGTTQTYILQTAEPAVTVAADAFFTTWKLPNDADPTTTVELVLSAQPYSDYTVPSGSTNPTIPVGTPSYTKTTKVDEGLIDPWAGGLSFTKEMGYFVLPAADATGMLPATGMITFWPQKVMTSTDGSTWTETPAAEMPANMEEYSYTMNGNVMVLTRGDKTTLTYYTILPIPFF